MEKVMKVGCSISIWEWYELGVKTK